MKYKLGKLCNVVSGGTPSRAIAGFWDGGTIPWIKIGSIKGKYVGEADEYITQAGLEGSSTKMLSAGTILFTIFATLGEVGILTIKACTNQAIAGITIKNQSEVSTDYLYYFLKSKKSYVTALGRGVAQNNINLSILRSFEVPIPALPMQKQIVDVLDKAEKIIEARQQELQQLDELVKARFIELFGDPVYNSKRLPIQRLCKLGSLDRGRSQHRPRNDPKLLNGPYPLIQTGEVASAGLYITKYKNTYSELGLRQSKMWSAGTLCITIAANIAQTAILTFDACFPDSVVGFLPNDSINAIYMHYWFGFFQKILEKQAPQVAQKNINLKILSELNVIVPTQEKQEQFAAFVEQTDKSKVAVQKALDEAQLLFDSLMQKYFG